VAAAHFNTAAREVDPGVNMVRGALEKLPAIFAVIQTAPDKPIGVQNLSRYLRGTVCSAPKLWLAAQEVTGLEGVTPPSYYCTTFLPSVSEAASRTVA
jgi:hypothetical protein